MATLMEQLDALTRRAWVSTTNHLLREQGQFSRLLMQRAKRDKPTGAKIEMGLQVKDPPVKWLANALDTYPTNVGGETHKAVQLDWADAVVALQITGKELRAQHGVNIQQLLRRNSMAEMPTNERDVLMSILNDQVKNAQRAFGVVLGSAIFTGRGEGGKITGLPAIIDDSTSDYAGMAYNASAIQTDDVTSTTYWEPYVSLHATPGTLRDFTLELFGTAINKVRRGGERPEDVVAVCNWDLYTTVELLVREQKDYRDDTKLASIGFDAIEWRHTTIMPDERATANKIYLCNLNHLWLQVRPSADFNNFEGWKSGVGPGGQDAAYGTVHPELQLCCNDRHRQALLGDIAGNSD